VQAFKTVGQMKVASVVAGVLAVVAASAAAASAAAGAAAAGLPLVEQSIIRGGGPWLGLAGLCALLYVALEKYGKAFVFVDYVHSERK
jgi:hypothetical protein